jgi:hypothetical protein
MSLIGQGASLRPGSRSHTNLVKSPGDAPKVQYIIDPTLPGLFEYPYAANRRFSKVVIPKGTICATGPAVKDYETLKYRNIITFADENKNPVGVASTSFFRRFKKVVDRETGEVTEVIAHDEFGGDDFQPTIITRELIEVPYIPNPNDVYTYGGATPVPNGMKFMWGCATNASVDSVGTSDELQAGDYVKSGPYGKFVKWNSGSDGAEKIVGQVLELETDLPPLGWLKMVEPVFEGYDSGREEWTAEPAPEDGSMVYDPDYKWPLTRDYRSPGAWKTIGGGFKGLTDGAQIALTTRIQRFTITSNEEGDLNKVFFLDPVVKVLEDTLSVTIGGMDVGYNYDASSQTLTITSDSVSSNDVVLVTYKVDPESLVGTPPAWDYAGSIGAVRILLKL